jgi:DNA invertase Pin-like site-specific DNA recombinase
MAQAQRVVKEFVRRGDIARTVQAMPITAKKLRVAAYCRVSTDDEEQLNSYKTQCEHYTAYIQKQAEWEFVGLYADEGITGTSIRKRKEFQRLIQDALDGKIDLILVKSVSRFARNTVDSLSTVRELRDRGIKIFFEKENIDSLDPKCDMILSIYSSLAEEESRSISTNIRWAHDKRIERGEVIYSFKNLYGYTQGKDKVVSVVEHEADVVRDIYHKYLTGYSIAEICRNLTQNGIQSRSGERWHFSTIDSMLQNEKFAGDVILRKTYSRDFLTERRVKNTGQAKQKLVENNHPAIVDRATWNAVQAEMERRSNMRSTEVTGKGRYDMRYAFSGIIQCGECGTAFRRHSHSRRNGDVERVWTCKEHIRGKQFCSQLSIREDRLERIFIRTFNRVLADRDRALQAVRQSLVEAIAEVGDGTSTADELAEVDASLERLQNEMLELNKRRTRREIDGEEYARTSTALMTEIDALFVKRDDLAEAQSTGALSTARCRIITELLESEAQKDSFDKDTFTKLVETVRVYSRDHITIIFKDGTELKADTNF